MAPASLPTDAELLQAAISYHPLQVLPNLSVSEVIAQMAHPHGDDFLPVSSPPMSPAPVSSTQTFPQRCAWVVENGMLRGVFTQADLLRLLSQGLSLTQVRVSEAMTLPGLSLLKSELTHIPAVLHLYQQYGVLDIPIVDAADHLIGVISQEQLLAQLNPMLLAESSQRQQLEINLRDSEHRYVSLAETAPVGIFRTNSQGSCTYVNERWSQIAGLTAEQAEGMGWMTAIHPLDRDRVQQEWQRSVTEGVTFQLEYRFLRLGGEVAWVWGLAGAEINTKGAVVGYIGTVLDITEQKWMEWAHQKSEQQLQEAQAIAHIGGWEANLENQQFTYWSPETYRIFELDPQNGLPSYAEFFAVIHPDDQEYVAQFCRTPVQAVTELEFVHRLQLSDGRIKYVQVRARTLYAPTGQPHRILGTTQDITEQQQRELERQQTAQQLEQLNTDLAVRVEQRTLELQHQALKFQDFLDNASDLILSLNLITGKLEYVNQAWRNVFGYVDAEIHALTLVDILHPESLSPKQHYLDYLKSPHPIQLQALKVEDLSQNWILTHVINSSEKSADRLTILDIFHPIFLKECFFQQHRWIKQRYPLSLKKLELKFLTKDQQDVVLEGSISFQIQAGHLISAQGIFRDISDQKAYEQHLQQTNLELERATRLKDEFLASMSHELRTPLNAVIGMSDGLLEEVFGPLNPRQLKALNTIEQSGRHLLDVINDILDLSKVEAGMMELELSTTSVLSLCQTSLSFVKQLALKKQIDLQLHISEALEGVNIQVDQLRMRQILINLLNNAVKFTPEQGQVKLSVSIQPPDPSHPATDCLPIPVLFAVSDTGIGIAEEDRVKLFDPFFQIDSRLNRQYTGTGLGLALVKRFVEMHGGTIAVESQLGVGSCFTVCIPCPVGTTAEHSPNLNADQFQQPVSLPDSLLLPDLMLSNRIILLVEDNPINVEAITSYLEHCGAQVIVASNGQQALDCLAHHHFDLILMDIQMPEMDGFETTKRIRDSATWSHIPIIALTALAMAGDVERCLQAGVNTYLTKPIKMRELVTTIQTLLP